MGAIKDIVDLAKDLESRAKDRHDMDTIHKIQALAFSLQSQQVETMERDARLMEENAELKRQLAEAQAEEIRIHHGIEFRLGKRTGDKWMGFCPKCHMPAQDASIPGFSSRTTIATCTAGCGWKVYTKVRLEEILKEI